MIRIAVLEDSQEDFNRLEGLLTRYSGESGQELSITRFADGMDFAESYKPRWDIIFMDIEMPLLDGMSAAKRIRTLDGTVNIIFVTNLRQYAIEGYSVSAVSYILKPATYPQVETLMHKLVRRLVIQREDCIHISTKTDSYRINVGDIICVEVIGNHKLGYRLSGRDGDIEVAGSLVKVEKELPRGRFAAVNSGCLVNLDYVKKVKRDAILVQDTEYPLSRTRRKDFLAALLAWNS